MRKLLEPAYLLVIIAALLLIIIFGGIYLITTFRFSGSLNGEGYSAVFLTNGQVYFGKLTNNDRYYTTLTNVYYLQVQQGTQQGQATTGNLVKLGDEVQGPKDEIRFNTEQILYIEHLRDDGQVVQRITGTQSP